VPLCAVLSAAAETFFFCFALCIKWLSVYIANMLYCALSVVSNKCLIEILLVTVHTNIYYIFTLC